MLSTANYEFSTTMGSQEEENTETTAARNHATGSSSPQDRRSDTRQEETTLRKTLTRCQFGYDVKDSKSQIVHLMGRGSLLRAASMHHAFMKAAATDSEMDPGAR